MRNLFPATLPVWPVTPEGRCGCGWKECRRPGKHADADAPEDSPAYAVLCGPGGVIVLDADVKGGTDGIVQLDKWDLPNTLEVHTPSNGMHVYLTHPGDRTLSNRKLDSAIDVRCNPRNDGGHSYVIGPGSPGYLKTDDPCVVVPGPPYEVANEAPIAAAPEELIAFLSIDVDRGEGFEPTPIDESSPYWESRIAKGIEWAKTMPPSMADGEGGNALLRLCIRLVRTLELPTGKALEIVDEHFNPRCTQADGSTPYPWADDEIIHKLEDARTKSSIPCGLNEGVSAGLVGRGKPEILKETLALLPEVAPRRAKKEGHRYTYKIGELAPDTDPSKMTRNELIGIFAKHPDWAGCWQYDEFAEQIVCVDPPIKLDAETQGLTPADLGDLVSVLEFQGVLSTEKEIAAALASAARHLSFHPVREYLAMLPEGDPSILDDLGRKLFGDERTVDLPSGRVYAANEFLKRFLVAAVRRMLRPGCQVDSILILHGPEQGEGKTRFVETLFGESWMRRGLPADLGNRDANHAIKGKWGIELGELASLLRTEKNAAKDFISGRVDVYRQYGNGEEIRRPRSCVFIGTTNDDDFLRDATGNRRYWPISIPPGHTVPLELVRSMRDAIWAAALKLAVLPDQVFPHWFSREEEKALHGVRNAFQEDDAWHEKIEAYCKGKDHVRASDVFLTAIGGELKDFDRRKLLRVTDSLKRIGCKKAVRAETKVWLVPSGLSTQKVSSPGAALKRVK